MLEIFIKISHKVRIQLSEILRDSQVINCVRSKNEFDDEINGTCQGNFTADNYFVRRRITKQREQVS